MRHCLSSGLVVLSLVAFAASPARAADDPEICRAESGDVAIEACNRVINSGKYSQAQLATAYVNRGQEYYVKKDYDRAYADFSMAIKINAGPDIAIAYGNRGNVDRQKNNLQAAIADYTNAVGLDPQYPAAFTGRGLTYEDLGKTALAIADYKHALSLKQRFDDGKWAHETAQRHLDKLKAGNAR
ncbi:MAG: tetratricopeptide repeat protein [Proteobacteria bacterium]|nr:tetratricopeptide repeat protein [Pseudomonadota bacterium]